MNSDIENYLEKKRKLVNTYLSKLYQADDQNGLKLFESINYSLQSDGKRLRPILCLAAFELFSGNSEKALGVACVLEMIHCYSLIHDDLPSMDNDSIRRGKPTNHIVFGESTAILAGDALLTDAFDLLVCELEENSVDPNLSLKIISRISGSIGSKGMILGQAMDLSIEGTEDVEIDKIREINYLKTGSLIKSSVLTGALLGGASGNDLKVLESFSKYLGLAFQITDDILDITGSKDFGKPAGSDAKNKKPTFASVLGTDKSKRMVADLTNKALSELEKLNRKRNPLKEITVYLSERSK